MPPILLLLPITWHFLLCVLCWGLLSWFSVWWNRLIRKTGLLPCCMISVCWGSGRRCLPPVSCHSHLMWGRLLLVLQFNQVAVGSVALCLPLMPLTVRQSHWLDIINCCLLLGQIIRTFRRLSGWTSCPSYWVVVQLIVEWHTAYLRHRWLGYLYMADFVSFVIYAWIAW